MKKAVTVSKTKLGILFILLSGLGYGATSVLTLTAFRDGATPWQVLLIQNTWTSTLLLITQFIRRKHLPKLKNDLRPILAMGLLGTSTAAICYTLSLRYITGSVATVIFFSYPIFVTVGARLFFMEKFTKERMAALGLAILGVVLTSGILGGEIGKSGRIGIALCLTAAIAASFSTLVSQRLVSNHEPLDIVIIQLFSAALFIVILVRGSGLANWEGAGHSLWLWGFLLTVVTSLLPGFFTIQGISYLGAYRASIAATTEIPITLLMLFLFFREHLSLLQWVGSGMIIGSVLMLRKK